MEPLRRKPKQAQSERRKSRVLFLARGEPTQYGYSWPERGADGPHDTPEGVAEAAKLYSRIFGDEGPWVMVEVHPIPDINLPIDEESAAICADLIEKGRRA